jgi:Ni/Co efflux regulator RcnB
VIATAAVTGGAASATTTAVARIATMGGMTTAVTRTGTTMGERLPSSYRARYYVVDDWRGHRLHQPPRGYHWVQVGADYVLIAIATGIIAQVLLAQ